MLNSICQQQDLVYSLSILTCMVWWQFLLLLVSTLEIAGQPTPTIKEGVGDPKKSTNTYLLNIYWLTLISPASIDLSIANPLIYKLVIYIYSCQLIYVFLFTCTQPLAPIHWRVVCLVDELFFCKIKPHQRN